MMLLIHAEQRNTDYELSDAPFTLVLTMYSTIMSLYIVSKLFYINAFEGNREDNFIYVCTHPSRKAALVYACTHPSREVALVHYRAPYGK